MRFISRAFVCRLRTTRFRVEVQVTFPVANRRARMV